MCFKTKKLEGIKFLLKLMRRAFLTHLSSLLQAYSDGNPDFPGPLLSEQEKKKGRNKRAPKGGDKPASRYKKRKKEGDEKQLMHSGPDTVMTQIKQVR